MANMYDYNSSTARKLSSDSYRYGHDLQSELHKTKEEIKPVSKKKTKPSNRLGNLVSVVLAFAAAFVIVNGYVAINEANNRITSLKNEYDNVVAGNQAIQVKIDKTIDLKQLQTIAGEKFGMVRPERYQMFYIDLERGDVAENTSADEIAEKEKKFAAMGAPGIITGTLNLFR